MTPLSYNPYETQMMSDNYLTNMRNGQASLAEQTYLMEEQQRLQNNLLRQQLQERFNAANGGAAGGPSYASGSRGVRGGGGGVDESMLPPITAPQYLSANAEEPGSNVDWSRITPDSLRGSGTIAMSIARPGESPDAADVYYRTLTQNPQWDTQRQARAQAEYDLTRGGGSGLDIARIQADTRLQGYENARMLAEMADKRRREESAANIGAKVGSDIVNRSTVPQAQGVLDESLSWANRQLQSGGGGVGGGQSAAPADVQVEVLGEMNGWKKIRKGGKVYAVKGNQEVLVDE